MKKKRKAPIAYANGDDVLPKVFACEKCQAPKSLQAHYDHSAGVLLLGCGVCDEAFLAVALQFSPGDEHAQDLADSVLLGDEDAAHRLAHLTAGVPMATKAEEG